MFGFLSCSDKNERVLKKMKNNRKRILISANGVVRLNLENDEVKAKIKSDAKKLLASS